MLPDFEGICAMNATLGVKQIACFSGVLRMWCHRHRVRAQINVLPAGERRPERPGRLAGGEDAAVGWNQDVSSACARLRAWSYNVDIACDREDVYTAFCRRFQ